MSIFTVMSPRMPQYLTDLLVLAQLAGWVLVFLLGLLIIFAIFTLIWSIFRDQ